MPVLTVFFFITFSFLSFATCMMDCSDSDKGVIPQKAGVVTIKTMCSPPGGPVHTSSQTYADKCENNVLDEMSCEGDLLKQTRFKCGSCSLTESGACLDPVIILAP